VILIRHHLIQRHLRVITQLVAVEFEVDGGFGYLFVVIQIGDGTGEGASQVAYALIRLVCFSGGVIRPMPADTARSLVALSLVSSSSREERV